MTQALAISKVPMVWSHSSVTRTRKPQWTMPVTQARQLSLEGAKAIAAQGGVVGLWALRSDVGQTPEAYGDRLSEMADWLGEDHVAFGTDMNGLIAPLMTSYADLRRVVDHLERRKMSEARIRKLAIENYARVLKAGDGRAASVARRQPTKPGRADLRLGARTCLASRSDLVPLSEVCGLACFFRNIAGLASCGINCKSIAFSQQTR